MVCNLSFNNTRLIFPISNCTAEVQNLLIEKKAALSAEALPDELRLPLKTTIKRLHYRPDSECFMLP